MVMKKVLITGGSHAEVPLIDEAKKMGFYVITTGNNVDGLGHQKADQYRKGDFSDKEFVYHLAWKENVDAIISGCNDFAYLSTAYACERLNLPGHDSYEVAKLIHHKNKFRTITHSLGILTPKLYECKSMEECLLISRKLEYPIVLKPIDLTGGKGVKLCYSLADIKEAFLEAKKLTREERVILEEYIQGTNHGATMLLKNRKVRFCFCDNEQYYLNSYLVSGACFPSDVPECSIVQLIGDVERMASHLQLVDGLFHVQFIVDSEQRAIMIDPCRRTPGDLYVKLVEYATEINYAREIVKAEIGFEIEEAYVSSFHYIARECVMTDRSGIFSEIELSETIRNKLIDTCIWAKKGEKIENYLTYKAGIVFLECKDRRELYEMVNDFHGLVKIKKG